MSARIVLSFLSYRVGDNSALSPARFPLFAVSREDYSAVQGQAKGGGLPFARPARLITSMEAMTQRKDRRMCREA
jgi:hypothetical protein